MTYSLQLCMQYKICINDILCSDDISPCRITHAVYCVVIKNVYRVPHLQLIDSKMEQAFNYLKKKFGINVLIYFNFFY